MTSTKIHALPHLNAGELSLVDLAAEDPRDVVALSEKEELILQLHHQIQEQELEKALLQQGTLIHACSCYISPYPVPRCYFHVNIWSFLSNII